MSARRVAALAVLFLPVLLTAGLGIGAGYGFSHVIRIPKVSELATYRPDIITELRAADGSIIARFAIERLILIERPEIPDIMVSALLAAEDARFYDHSGIDLIRIGGAAIRDLATRRMSQGASTLTQQLARAVFLTPEKTWARKINEVFLTVEIEKQFSKDQILTMYLNQIPFGHGTYGVEAASRWYFGHGAKTLTLPEAALLAGLVQRPAYYSPFNHATAAKNRRDLVLRRMAEEGFLSDAQRAAAQGAPVEVIRSSRETTLGLYFCEEVRQYLEKEYGEGDLYREGLRVDTTLDPRLETWAEEALRRGLRRIDRRSGFRKPRNLVAEGIDPDKYRDPSWAEGAPPSDTLTAVVLQASKTGAEVRVGTKRFTVPAAAFRWTRAESPAKAVQRGDVIQIETSRNEAGKEETLVAQDPRVEGAVVIVENGTGAVRALTGGYDFNRSKFDRAVQALRQVGSAFKPAVYLAAIEQGFTPADTVLDAPLSIVIDPKQPPWEPQNYERKYNGIVTYQYALEHSLNVATVRVDLLVSTRKVIEAARRLDDLPRADEQVHAYGRDVQRMLERVLVRHDAVVLALVVLRLPGRLLRVDDDRERRVEHRVRGCEALLDGRQVHGRLESGAPAERAHRAGAVLEDDDRPFDVGVLCDERLLLARVVQGRLDLDQVSPLDGLRGALGARPPESGRGDGEPLRVDPHLGARLRGREDDGRERVGRGKARGPGRVAVLLGVDPFGDEVARLAEARAAVDAPKPLAQGVLHPGLEPRVERRVDAQALAVKVPFPVLLLEVLADLLAEVEAERR